MLKPPPMSRGMRIRAVIDTTLLVGLMGCVVYTFVSLVT